MSEYGTTLRHADFAPLPPRDRRLRLAISFAKMIKAGKLNMVLPDGSTHFFEGEAPGPSATLIVHDPKMVAKLAFGGSLGLCEGYLVGMWDSPNVTEVLRLGTANEIAFDEMLRGKPWARFISWATHKLRPNTRKGARRNIAEHYDLGNDFYREWLDPSMTYSSAIFPPGVDDLETAQAEKYRRLCRALELTPGMTLLEIGCGWGGFAAIAAAEFGAIVTGITLSAEQLAYGRARMKAAGLDDQVELRLEDYRDTTGSFDRIASIEMFEAVGEEYWPAYFRTLRDRLRPGGRAGLQVITIADRFFEDYRKTADFIQRYIFPGGMLPCPARLREEIAKAGLQGGEILWFGRDYAKTLSRWRESFMSRWGRISSISRQYDQRFHRLWEFYLGYCEVGFDAGYTDVGQIVIEKV